MQLMLPADLQELQHSRTFSPKSLTARSVPTAAFPLILVQCYHVRATQNTAFPPETLAVLEAISNHDVRVSGETKIRRNVP